MREELPELCWAQGGPRAGVLTALAMEPKWHVSRTKKKVTEERERNPCNLSIMRNKFGSTMFQEIQNNLTILQKILAIIACGGTIQEIAAPQI